MLAGSVALILVYVAIDRFGVKVPLKPFFAVTSAMLYYMAFVFAGKGIADLQEAGLVRTTVVEWAPRIPLLGIYPTVQSLALQFLLLVLLLVAVVWLQRTGSSRQKSGGDRRSPEPQPEPVVPPLATDHSGGLCYPTFTGPPVDPSGARDTRGGAGAGEGRSCSGSRQR